MSHPARARFRRAAPVPEAISLWLRFGVIATPKHAPPSAFPPA